MSNDVVVFDIETVAGPDQVEGGWENPEAMGFGCAVAYNYAKDVYVFYGPGEQNALRELLAGSIVVTFNGIRFDYRVLYGNDYPMLTGRLSPEGFAGEVDLLLEVVKGKFAVDSVEEAEQRYGKVAVHNGSINLDGLSQGTLHRWKTGSGAHAPILIAEGRWAEVYEYCLNDVRLTKGLFEYAKRYHRLVDRNRYVIQVSPFVF